jgi:hypothetical protein
MSKKTPDSLKTAVNPFLEELVIPIVILSKYENRVDPSSIKVEGNTVVSTGFSDTVKRSYVQEKDRKVTLYFENNGVDLRSVFSRLSKEGRTLFDYILFYCLREDKLYCYIDYQEFMQVYNIASRTTVLNCKKNLIDNGFIAATSVKNWYWINPRLFFRGTRSKCKELKDNLINGRDN